MHADIDTTPIYHDVLVGYTNHLAFGLPGGDLSTWAIIALWVVPIAAAVGGVTIFGGEGTPMRWVIGLVAPITALLGTVLSSFIILSTDSGGTGYDANTVDHPRSSFLMAYDKPAYAAARDNDRSDARIRAAVKAEYGLTVESFGHAPFGSDSLAVVVSDDQHNRRSCLLQPNPDAKHSVLLCNGSEPKRR